MVITKHERRQLVRLLGELQTHLESSIETRLVPGTHQPREADRGQVARDRAQWATAEALVKRLVEADFGGQQVVVRRGRRTGSPNGRGN